jgi:hypothetical protein
MADKVLDMNDFRLFQIEESSEGVFDTFASECAGKPGACAARAYRITVNPDILFKSRFRPTG